MKIVPRESTTGIREMIKRYIQAASAIFLFGATSASAALLDFTDPANFTPSGTILGGVSYNIEVVVPGDDEGELTYNDGNDGNGDIGPGPLLIPPLNKTLNGTGDGLGINDDEVSPEQALIVTFGEPLFIDAIYLLDFFVVPGDTERASISANGSIVAEFVADDDQFPSAGLGAFVAGTDYDRFFTSQLTIPAGPGNDGRGVGDFSLAALEVSQVPLPAGALLLGTALLGLAVVRRRA